MNFSGKIDVSSIKSIFGNLGKNLGWMFLLFFIILIVCEIKVMNYSAKIILDSNKVPVSGKKSEGVRINFPGYEKVIFRKEQAQSYEPSNEAVVNPFIKAN